MSRPATHYTPYVLFLRVHDTNDHVDALGFSSPLCVYNNGSCGAPCSIKPNGQPYRKCDAHRLDLDDAVERANVPLDEDQFLSWLMTVTDTLPPLGEFDTLYAETDDDAFDDQTYSLDVIDDLLHDLEDDIAE